jgi:hypothetical protein
LSVEVDHSDGVRRYEVLNSETSTPNPSERREVYEWQGRTFNHIEMNPLDNLAQHGMDEFEKDPSMLKPLSYPLHALGDVTVPMHVVGTSSWGHGPFEAAVDELFPEILFQHGDVQQEATDQERVQQLEQARRILLDGFRWWQWLRDFRAENPEWGQLPIRPFMLELAKETRRNGDELLIDDASFLDVMANVTNTVAETLDGSLQDANEQSTKDANESIAAYNARTGAALAPILVTTISFGNVYHSLLPIVRERVEASAGAQVAFLTILGSELVEPLADNETTACAGLQPRCAAGQSAADGSCLDAAALCPDGTIPNPNAEGECMAATPTCTPGQHLNQETNSCEYCAIDRTLAWSEVNCTGGITVPLEAASAPDDNCPNEYWIALDNVSLATGATLFEAKVTKFGDEATCTTIAANVDLYTSKTDGTFDHLGNTSGFGELIGATCEPPAGLQVARNLVSGRPEVRVRALLYPDPGGASLQLGAVDGNTCPREIQ